MNEGELVLSSAFQWYTHPEWTEQKEKGQNVVVL